MYSGDEFYGEEITSPLFRPQAEPAKDFDAWIAKLDIICWKRVGCSLDDLEDFDTESGYEDGYSPRAFFNGVIAPEVGL